MGVREQGEGKEGGQKGNKGLGCKMSGWTRKKEQGAWVSGR